MEPSEPLGKSGLILCLVVQVSLAEDVSLAELAEDVSLAGLFGRSTGLFGRRCLILCLDLLFCSFCMYTHTRTHTHTHTHARTHTHTHTHTKCDAMELAMQLSKLFGTSCVIVCLDLLFYFFCIYTHTHTYKHTHTHTHTHTHKYTHTRTPDVTQWNRLNSLARVV